MDGKDAADLAQMKKETNIEKYPKLIRILPQGDSESQLVESQLAESQSTEIQPAGSQSILKVSNKGAGQGLKYLENNLCRSPLFQTFQHTMLFKI